MIIIHKPQSSLVSRIMIIDYDPVSGGGGEMVDRLMDHQMFSRLLSTSTAIIPVTIVL